MHRTGSYRVRNGPDILTTTSSTRPGARQRQHGHQSPGDFYVGQLNCGSFSYTRKYVPLFEPADVVGSFGFYAEILVVKTNCEPLSTLSKETVRFF